MVHQVLSVGLENLNSGRCRQRLTESLIRARRQPESLSGQCRSGDAAAERRPERRGCKIPVGIQQVWEGVKRLLKVTGGMEQVGEEVSRL